MCKARSIKAYHIVRQVITCQSSLKFYKYPKKVIGLSPPEMVDKMGGKAASE